MWYLTYVSESSTFVHFNIFVLCVVKYTKFTILTIKFTVQWY